MMYVYVCRYERKQRQIDQKENEIISMDQDYMGKNILDKNMKKVSDFFKDLDENSQVYR